VLLFIAVLFLAGAAFAVAEVATYPARLKERSIRRAAEYGRLRAPDKADELLKFRERVLEPAAAKLAAIPLKLNPKLSIESISARLLAAGLAQRLRWSSPPASATAATRCAAICRTRSTSWP
jgi:hypothetical protein